MKHLREIIAAMSQEVKAELIELGFRKRTGDVFTRDIGGEMLGRIGFIRATYNNRGPLDVTPVIGIRDQEVERRIAELLDERFHHYSSATVSTPVGYLMPEQTYRLWRIASLAEVPRQVRDMVTAIENCGIPFMQANASHEALVAIMKRAPAYEPYFYRLPVALWLIGRPRETAAEVARIAARIGDRTDAAAQRYKQFADALTRRLPS